MYTLFLTWKYPYKGNIDYAFVKDQAEALAEVGAKVVVAHVMPRNFLKLPTLGLVKELEGRVKVYHYFIPSLPKIESLTFALMKHYFRHLYKIIEREQGSPDIIHAHFGIMAGACAAALKLGDLPIVMTEHGTWVKGLKPHTFAWRRQKLAIQGAQKVVAVGRNLAKALLPFSCDIQIIPNLVRMKGFTLSHHAGNGFRFVSLGHLIKRKGFDILLKAFAKAFRSDSSVTLRIGGAGPEDGFLKNLTRELGITDQVEFAGRVIREDLDHFFSDADCFVLPSRFETFGVVYIEAMACGLPVIASICGGPEDFIEEKDGLLIPVDNEDSLIAALRKMKDSGHLYNRELIRKGCESRFDSQNVANQIMNVYESALSSKR